ncbi:MAG TPA: OmpA family protein [Allosphingosinicella sp.]|nr:OmpA family protein [Allosphingosinicella sp.]
MKVPLPILALLIIPLASCEPPAEHRGAAGNVVEPPPATAPKANSAATSIMRPEVAEEAGAQSAPPPAERLRATVQFGDSGVALDGAAKAAIDALLVHERFAEGGPITVSGHSDSAGSDAQNIAASRRRAEAVRDYLVSKGVAPERITVIALGERRPLAPNAQPDGSDFPEGRQRNRRVEITVEPPPVADPTPASPTKAAPSGA